MPLVINPLKCCAIHEIHGLNTYPTAESAMIAFCQQHIAAVPKWNNIAAHAGSMFPFYLFTAAVYSDIHNAIMIYGRGYNRSYQYYGAEFAQLIRDNKLGDLVESPIKRHNAFYDHDNQVWIWMPDRDALVAWWTKKKVELKLD